MVEECLSRVPERLCEVSVCPQPECFDALPELVRVRWHIRAATARAAGLSVITAADWLRFSQTGDRAQYEALYFSRRRRLTDLVCGVLSGAPENCMDAVLDTVWGICEESAWQLPAHNGYVRDAPQLSWPDVENPVVDLFAAETGALLACTCAALRDMLPEAVHRRVRFEVERRILVPCSTMHFWWMGGGDEPLNNWTPWCTQNVLLCVFALPFSQQMRHAVIVQAAHSLDCFLKDYGHDGCCNEGAQYYTHAGLCLFGCLELLYTAAPSAFEGLWREQKIQNIAAYIYCMHVDGPYYVNFADCSPFAGRRGAREYLFALRTENPDMARFAAQDWRAGLTSPDENGDIARINLWYQLLEARAASDMNRAANAPPPVPSGDIYYPSVGVFFVRRGGWCLAAKAGCNADSHNHNDTGSVILYRYGKPFLIDVGVETYTKKTFSDQRYEIWTMQSQWHNLPTFGGVQQQAGAAFRAQDVRTAFSGNDAEISMELSAAWPAEARLERFTRTVRLEKASFTLYDVCSGEYETAFLSLMLCEAPQADGCRIRVGALGTLFFEGACGPIETDTLPITDARLRIAWPAVLYRLRIPFTSKLMVKAE